MAANACENERKPGEENAAKAAQENSRLAKKAQRVSLKYLTRREICAMSLLMKPMKRK